MDLRQLVLLYHIIDNNLVQNEQEMARNNKWKILISWDVTTGRWINNFRRFEIRYCLHFHGQALLDTEDKGDTILRNVGNYSPNDTSITSQKTRLFSSTAVRTLHLANNKHIFTSTLHFQVLKILPDMSGRRGIYITEYSGSNKNSSHLYVLCPTTFPRSPHHN